MPKRKQARAGQAESFPSSVQELSQLLIAYARQETIEPIKGLGRYVGFGLAGSFVMGIGLVLLLLGSLRLLQTETGDAFDGNWSFVPYLFTLVAAGTVAGAALKAKGSKTKGDE